MPKGQYPALPHDPMNVMTMCHRCHFFWWHKNPLDAWEWLRETMGDGLVVSLRLAAQTRSKVDKATERVYLERLLASVA